MHGVRIRVLEGNGDLITLQSTIQKTRRLDMGRAGLFKRPVPLDITIGGNELAVLKSNAGGEALIEITGRGNSDGALIIEQCEERRALCAGDRCVLKVKEGATIVMRSPTLRDPTGRMLADGHIAGPADGWSGTA